ncbi:MAG TPA: putative glycoside hydrolase, partial [Spirochaetota bacterium]
MKITPSRILIIVLSASLISGIITLAILYIHPDENQFTIIDPLKDRSQIATYRNLPKEFLHCGNFLFYRGLSETSTSRLADKALPFTSYYRESKLEKAICEFNHIKKGPIEAGKAILIPHSLPSRIPDMKNRMKSPLIFTRGLYYTGSSAGRESIIESISKSAQSGVNTVVFDAKDVTGIINYNSRIPEVLDLGTSEKRSIDDVDKLIRALKANGIYVIARVAVFRDQLLAKKMPDCAIHSRITGKIWNEKVNEIWCDPTNKETQDYNLQIAIELAEKGVDEIQFDYIRFPTSGDLSDARFAWSFGSSSKEHAIEQFLSRAYQELSRRNVNVSIDVFGVVAWGHEKDIEKTGQRIELLSKYCDVISPML